MNSTDGLSVSYYTVMTLFCQPLVTQAIPWRITGRFPGEIPKRIPEGILRGIPDENLAEFPWEISPVVPGKIPVAIAGEILEMILLVLSGEIFLQNLQKEYEKEFLE